MRFICTLLSTLSLPDILLDGLTANTVFIEGSLQELKLARYPNLVGLCYRDPGAIGETSRNGVCCFSMEHGPSTRIPLCFSP